MPAVETSAGIYCVTNPPLSPKVSDSKDMITRYILEHRPSFPLDSSYFSVGYLFIPRH